MRYIHIMKAEKFTKGVSEFYDAFFADSGHEILYVNKKGEKSLISSEIAIPQAEIFFSKNKRKRIGEILNFIDKINQYDYIVFHSLLFPFWLQAGLSINKRILNKMIWIEWGADLYNWCDDKRHGFKEKIRAILGNRIRNHCNTFVGIFPPDCDYFREHFPRAKAKVFYAPYCAAHIPDCYLKPYSKKSNLQAHAMNGEPITILVGHNATPTLHHEDVLNMLLKYKSENIKLLLPLSYPDNKEYANKIQKLAEESFPGKVVCLRKMMSKNDYFALLETVDIAIFNTYRQAGLGNIYRLIYNNAKIYMAEPGVMYQYFKSNGVPVQKYEHIENEDYAEFISAVNFETPELFEKYMEGRSDMAPKINCWKTIYDSLAETRGKI